MRNFTSFFRKQPIIAYKDGQFEGEYDNIKDFLAKHPDLHKQSVYDCINPHIIWRYSHKGYTFGFKDERYNVKNGYVEPNKSSLIRQMNGTQS